MALLMSVTVVINARDTYARDITALPQAAQVTLKSKFKADVSVIKIDKTMGRVDEYEVTLKNGTEVTFDRDGNIKSVEVGASESVPAKIIPEGIIKYVKDNHKGTRIVGFEVNRGGYEIDLSDGIDLKFDKAGNFQRYD